MGSDHRGSKITRSCDTVDIHKVACANIIRTVSEEENASRRVLNKGDTQLGKVVSYDAVQSDGILTSRLLDAQLAKLRYLSDKR